MEKKVVIYGKNNCPFTKAAREAYTRKKIDFQYIDVLQNPAELDRMLEFSKGERKVPVIIDNDHVIIGHDGKG